MTMQIKDLPENKIETPATRLKTARENKGLTRRKLSEITGIPAKTIEKYEYGGSEPGFTRLKSLCSALDIEASDVLKLDTQKTPEQQSPNSSNDNSGMDDSTDNADNYSSECIIHLDALDRLREAGFGLATRKAYAHHNALKSALCFLEYNELKELAEARGIKIEETISEGLEDNGQETSLPDCEGLANRIIDTAVFGVDFYSIDLKALSDIAENYDLAPDRFIWAGWRGHQEIIPKIREQFLEKQLQDESEEDFSDTEKFPKK